MDNKVLSLQHGVQIPVVGLGTWQLVSPEDCKDAVRAALDAGYRHIDTAFFYFNERYIGEVLQEYFNAGKLKREEIFITTKLSVTHHQKERVSVSIDESLKNLQLEYVDLFLIHIPCAMKKVQGDEGTNNLICDDVKLEETWQAMEELFTNGKTKAIGVSNFNKRQLERILKISTTKPAINQVECHLYFQQTKLSDFMRENDILLIAYSPLGSPDRPSIKREDDPVVLNDPLAKQLAEKYKKSVAQVLLRFLVQQGIPVIPKSTHADRIKENIQVFDFELTDCEMSSLAAQDRNKRLVTSAIFKDHSEYPFNDEY